MKDQRLPAEFKYKSLKVKMRVLTILRASLSLALFSYFPLAHAAENISSAHKHKHRTAIVKTEIVPQAMPAAPDEAKNLAWTTHALPKGDWVFTRYHINGSYPDNYP